MKTINALGEIITGKTPQTSHSDYFGSDIPFITPRDMKGNRTIVQTERYLSHKGAQTVKNCIIPANSICVSCIGSDMGKVVLTTSTSVTNQQINSIIIDETNDPRFVYYLMCALSEQIKSLGKNATAVPILNKTKFSNISIDFPLLEKQKRIADILSAYDDLIENNQNQIKLLEEAAMRLYQEWFVNLRFPGHETTKIVDGVPEGWNIKHLIDIADITMGQSPKSEYYNDKQRGLPFHQGVTNYGHRFVTDEMYSTSFTRIAEAGSILFSVRAPVGRMNITKNKIVIGRGLAAINHKDELQSLLFYMIKNRFYKDNLIGNGSIYASITKDVLYSQKFLIPDDDFANDFNSIVKDIDQRISNADRQIILLQQARDRLLPKLMSEEIEVRCFGS